MSEGSQQGSRAHAFGGRRRTHRGRGRAAGLLLAIVALLALFATACGDDGSSTPAADGDGDGDSVSTTTSGAPDGEAGLEPQPLAERTKVRVAWPIGVEAFGSVIVADALGEFEKENLEVEFIVVPPSEAIALLQTDRADVWVTSVNATLFNAVDSGIDLRWVAPTFYPNPDSLSGLWLKSDLYDASGNVDVEKVKGTTIGLGAGGGGAVTTPLIEQWLKSVGLTFDDIKIDSSLNGAEILIGIENGALDGGWLSDPVWLSAQESNLGKPVATQAGEFGSYALSGYMVHGRMLDDEHRPVTEAFLRGLARANRDHLQGDYHQDDAVVDAIAEASGTSAEDVKAALPVRFDPSLEIDPEIVDILQQSWLGIGDILEYDEPIPASKIIDQSVVPELP